MTSRRSTSRKGKNTKPELIADVGPDLAVSDAHTNFVVAFAITKVDAIKRITSIARRAGLDYDGLRSAMQVVRKELGLVRPRGRKKLPRLPSRREMAAFFAAVDAAGNLRDQVMLRLLAYTSVRVAALVAIARKHVDLDQLTVRVVQRKGSKDRTTLIPASFRLALQDFIERGPRSGRQFICRLGTPLSTRRVQQVIADYGAAAPVRRVRPRGPGDK